jgi:hypothetical protein
MYSTFFYYLFIVYNGREYNPPTQLNKQLAYGKLREKTHHIPSGNPIVANIAPRNHIRHVHSDGVEGRDMNMRWRDSSLSGDSNGEFYMYNFLLQFVRKYHQTENDDCHVC